MATVTIKIETDGDAFADGNEAQEVSRILSKLVRLMANMEQVPHKHELWDINGNTVGSINRAITCD